MSAAADARRRAVHSYRFVTAFLLIDRNLILNFIAFCATAPGVRRSFLATCGPDSFFLANARRFFTSWVDHAEINRRFAFAIDAPDRETYIIPPQNQESVVTAL
jgi:hypothetical protein